MYDNAEVQKIQLNAADGQVSWFNGGNVGIGTLLSAYKLDVNGIAKATYLYAPILDTTTLGWGLAQYL